MNGKKQLYEYFKQQVDEMANEKTWTWLIKGNLTHSARAVEYTDCISTEE